MIPMSLRHAVLLVLLFSCPVTAMVTGPDVFLSAFQRADYPAALASLAEVSDDPLAPVYRATCLTMMQRSDEAADLFRRAASDSGAFAQVALFAQAQALFDLRCYARAQTVLDRLARRFPHGRFAERGLDLALRIERRLSDGLTQANVEWYQDQGLAAYAQAHSGLAAEYLEEYRLLAERLGSASEPKAMLTLTAVALELDDHALMASSITLVPPATADWRGALYRGLVHVAAGEVADAKTDLHEARLNSTDATVKKRVDDVLADIDAPEPSKASAP